MKDFLKRLINNEYASLQEDIEDLAAKKIVSKIREKKQEILTDLNSKKSKKA